MSTTKSTDTLANSSVFPLPQAPPENETTPVFAPRFDAQGLIPAIATDHQTGEVLMFAWMNTDALDRTIATGTAHFWSRSRSMLWLKGEESGNILHVVEMRTDCDQDVIWLRVGVAGPGKACHTGARTCFYRIVRRLESDGRPIVALDRVNGC